jgi:predicted nucleotidyltransferase
MKDIYIWVVGDKAIWHSDLDAAAEFDGLSAPPDMTVSEEQFYAVGGLVRVIGSEIVLGKTEQELAKEAVFARAAEIDARFLAIEQKLIRPMLAKTRDAATEKDIEKLNALSAEAETLRAERKELESSYHQTGAGMTDAIQSELNALKEIIAGGFAVEQIYLFGSYAYGVPHKGSDLDLYVVLRDNVSLQNFEVMMQIREAIADKRTMPVDIIDKKKQKFLALCRDDAVAKKSKPFLACRQASFEETIEQTVIRNGICIYGGE